MLLTSGEAIQARRLKLPRDRTDCSAELPPEPDLAAPESVICTTYQRALSAFRESPVDSIDEVRVREMQVPTCGRDVGMAHQALDDVDVHAPAHEARGVGVTPPVGEVPTGHALIQPSTRRVEAGNVIG